MRHFRDVVFLILKVVFITNDARNFFAERTALSTRAHFRNDDELGFPQRIWIPRFAFTPACAFWEHDILVAYDVFKGGK
ncbi:hypothetical protein DKC09_03180 (plasmid) [Klebsiella quasipneumoniae]|uniref:Uncharacterized protein n=1 Tax=Klebsiella quasipneumoniae TaxID=1463165 RepID=A0AAI8NJA9_9ENTR|nr:hypothetical protein DKC11_04305 [Klebsiella quasipneumoniae]OHY60948.1 hypothetical protein BB778_26595 [Pluralibacter gergoviae]HBY4049479.1 hypothetical protein [Klebsiella pneumoniae]AWL61027.1 hypothetical protein DKC00_04465 [Klebsiella quasipneumoniae]AWL72184.1 hypothetical protein DKC09_03180 [Klebsiella quasipneumoniae]